MDSHIIDRDIFKIKRNAPDPGIYEAPIIDHRIVHAIPRTIHIPKPVQQSDWLPNPPKRVIPKRPNPVFIDRSIRDAFPQPLPYPGPGTYSYESDEHYLALPGVGFNQSAPRFKPLVQSDGPSPVSYQQYRPIVSKTNQTPEFLNRSSYNPKLSETPARLGPGFYNPETGGKSNYIPPFDGQSDRFQSKPNDNPGPGTYYDDPCRDRDAIIFHTRYPKYNHFMHPIPDAPAPDSYLISRDLPQKGQTIRPIPHNYPILKTISPGPAAGYNPYSNGDWIKRSYNICCKNLNSF